MRKCLAARSSARTLVAGLLAAAAWTVPQQALAALALPALLSDGVVFQRGKPIRLWGTAAPGEKVGAMWGALSGTTTADSGGAWRIDLPPVHTSPGDSIVVRGQSNEQVRILNPVLGQVWICGGQSNMALPLRRTKEANASTDPLPAPAGVRLYRVPMPDGRRAGQGRWIADSPAAASAFSAVCYLTGRMLAAHAKDTVGLIDTSVGATDINAWIPRPATAVVNQGGSRPAPRRHSMSEVGSAFEAMVRPIAPFSARGLLWYQGEGDARNPDRYADVFVSAMRQWRESLEQADLPIIYMQLPVFEASPFRAGWNEIRNQQARAERMLPGLLMAPSDGIVATEIHPTGKADVARRLFLRATGSRP